MNEWNFIAQHGQLNIFLRSKCRMQYKEQFQSLTDKTGLVAAALEFVTRQL